MTRARLIFHKIKELFQELVGTGDFIDVDMLVSEVKTRLKIQDYDELLSDFIEALVRMTRDDDMYDYFGYQGIGILFLELNDWANKLFREV